MSGQSSDIALMLGSLRSSSKSALCATFIDEVRQIPASWQRWDGAPVGAHVPASGKVAVWRGWGSRTWRAPPMGPCSACVASGSMRIHRRYLQPHCCWTWRARVYRLVSGIYVRLGFARFVCSLTGRESLYTRCHINAYVLRHTVTIWGSGIWSENMVRSRGKAIVVKLNYTNRMWSDCPTRHPTCFYSATMWWWWLCYPCTRYLLTTAGGVANSNTTIYRAPVSCKITKPPFTACRWRDRPDNTTLMSDQAHISGPLISTNAHYCDTPLVGPL
jgi:hypothetical protein